MTHACVKEKRHFLLTKGTIFLSLSGSDKQIDNLVLACLGTMHTSLDVASVSPFHPVAAPSLSLSRSALCWNIQDPQMNYKLTLTGLWQTSGRKLTLMVARNTKCGRIHTWKELTYFDTLTGGFNHFNVFRKNSLIHGMVVEPRK